MSKEDISTITIIYNIKDELKIKLRGIDDITNMSCIFYECSSLLSIPDISKWNTSNVII